MTTKIDTGNLWQQCRNIMAIRCASAPDKLQPDSSFPGKVSAVFAAVLSLATLFGWAPNSAKAAEPPGVLNHQGRIAVDGVNYDGAGYFKFSLIKDADGTEAILWHHDGSALGSTAPAGELNVNVDKGHYAVLLGDATAPLSMTPIPASVFAENENVSLRIWFSTTSGSGFEQLMPDRRVASVGYALTAASVPDGAITSAMLADGLASQWTVTGTGDISFNENSVISTGTFGIGTVPVAGAGTRLMWVPGKSAFRAGTVDGGEWDVANVGDFSTAMGRGTTARGAYSTAMGRRTTASGVYSTASGDFSAARGAFSTAMGLQTTASGAFSTAMGRGTTASGAYSTASGVYSTARGDYSTASGVYSTASGAFSTAMGLQTTAPSHAEAVLGQFNTGYAPASATSWNPTDRLFVVGNGTADADRSDALVVLKNGNVTIGGSITLAGNGTFSGDGSGLTNIPAGAVVTPPPGMVLIPAGEFTMGDSLDGWSNAVPISTTVSAFYMDVNEVTLSQWQVVQQWGTLVGGYTGLAAGSGKGPDHPVQTVNWYAVVKWCNARSEREGKTPVYYTDNEQTMVYRTGDVDVTNVQVKWTANGYRLPTEAEWEKAARGGLAGKRFPWGDTISQKQANYRGLTGSYAYDEGPDGYNAIGSVGGTSPATSPVGSFAANGYGLNDMAGNVYEWCWDWYGTPYTGGADPQGPATGSYRVLRGGNWRNSAYYARCAYRNNYYPGFANSFIGFRAVLAPGQP
jgi:formylglycine-generating enzyme required for sulfatase activity